MSDQPDVKALWQTIQDVLHEGDINRSLWDAAARAVPLTLEEDVFVVGFEPGKMREASYLTSGGNRPQVMAALERVVGRRVELHTVEGTTMAAWESEKTRREINVEQAQASYEARNLKGARATWAQLYEAIGETFGGSRARRFAINRASTFVKALKVAIEAEEQARAEEPDLDDIHFQQLNRTLERIATLAELPPTVVAVEYLRLKATRE